LHSHHGAAAAAPTSGGIALDERQLGGNTDDRAVGWSFDESRDEVVVEATASPVMAFTAVRLCHALLNEKATAQTLTPENLNGGPDRFDLEGLVISNPYVLRKGRTIGWLKNIDCEGSRFLDRLRQARNELLQACRDVAEQAEDGVYDSDSLGAILRKAHGLQGVLVGLYDLLGYDVVRRLRVPDPWSIDDEAFAHFLLHQTSCSARYGAYTAHRVLYEPRSEKREDALGTPAVDSDDYHGTLAGSWTIVGPDLDGLRDALQEPSHDLTLQDDNLNYADFCLDLDVVDGNRREAVAEVVARLAPYKNLEATRTMTTLLQALSGSTAAAAAALDAMGQAEDTRLLDHGDLARGLATIVDAEYYSAFGPADLVPDIGGRTVSKAVATLIGEQTALSTTALAEAAGVSTQSLRDNRVHFERLAALGFLELMTGDPGCPNEWAFSFPDAGGQPPGSTGENGTAGLGTAIFDQSGWGGESWRLDEAIHEYLLRLVDEYGHDLPVGLDDDRVLTAVTGPPDQRTLQPLLAALPALRPILSLLALLLEESLPVADDSLTVRLGATPTVAGTQQSLATAATD
jgi:hypothetical protein